MADAKLTALTELAAASTDDLLYVVDDPAGSPVSQKITAGNLLGAQFVTLATHATLPNERVLTAGTALDLTDAGAGSTVTVDLDFTEFTEETAPIKTDHVPFIDDPGGSPLHRKTTIANLTKGLDFSVLTADDPALADSLPFHDATGSDTNKATLAYLLAQGGFIPGGRLTLTSGTAVTTSDVTAAGTLYYTPYLHDRIRIFDGTRWQYYTFTERSLSLSLTSGKPYDIWIYDNAGTLTLEALVWTNDTTRATALTTQDGVYVKNGATTRLYLGSIYASGTNTTEDSFAKRYVFNAYNQVLRGMRVLEATDSWTYATASWRQANGASGNQLDLMVGLAGHAVHAHAVAFVGQGNGNSYVPGIGYDATNALVSGTVKSYAGNGAGGTIYQGVVASLHHYPAVGRHFYSWLENAVTASTTTIYGDNGDATTYQAGITGMTVM